MASRGGQLGRTRPSREDSCEQSGHQGRAVGRDQAYKGGQLGTIKPAGRAVRGQRREVGGDWACRKGLLGGPRPAGESSWGLPGLQGRTLGGGGGGPGLQGRAVRGDQAGRGGQLGAIRLAGEQLDINQAGMAVVRW
uniref:Uncharacterized protein n=1 Tax=Pipistrellus kuhlii TaxID=59472 RepID=A0A7J7ZJK6_PIPKU|nr:hypothetical protein mPipKuh1_009545 [Pipistrellus kuhlii]